jgi:hypothetical protein
MTAAELLHPACSVTTPPHHSNAHHLWLVGGRHLTACLFAGGTGWGEAHAGQPGGYVRVAYGHASFMNGIVYGVKWTNN